jgi:ankyrin repeat protein
MPSTGRNEDVYEQGGLPEDVAADFKDVLDAAHLYEFDKEDDIRRWEEALRQNQHDDADADEIDVKSLLHSLLRINNRTHATLLHAFVKSSTPPPRRFARWLLTEKPDMIEQVDSDSRTPLHLALSLETTDAFEFMKLASSVCKKATLSKVLALKDVGDHNCLHYAILNNFPWTLELIKICESDLSLFTASNKNGRTPLHLAMVPPAAKQQQAKETRRRLGGVKRLGQPENRILTKVGTKTDTISNKMQSPIQPSKNDILDKGLNSKYKPVVGP